jgi:hypothetical protein
MPPLFQMPLQSMNQDYVYGGNALYSPVRADLFHLHHGGLQVTLAFAGAWSPTGRIDRGRLDLQAFALRNIREHQRAPTPGNVRLQIERPDSRSPDAACHDKCSPDIRNSSDQGR